MTTPHFPYLEQLSGLTPPKISFEFFPPKTPKMETQLWESITKLESLNPHFVSVTYGAGGSTRERTHETVKRLIDETSLSPAAHLTCVGATREEINAIAQDYWDIGVKHIVALRGDPPGGETCYQPHPEGYERSIDLVKGLKEIADFEISVASFPEVHPEAENAQKDLEFLKKKIDAGATRAITQFCFDTDALLSFIDKAKDIGISVPIVPGIVLISNFQQLVKFSQNCGATIPKWVHKLMQGLDEYPEKRNIISAMIAAEQCRRLLDAGVEELHFYTLNRADLVEAVCHILGIRPTYLYDDLT